jgi:hypothetical protein
MDGRGFLRPDWIAALREVIHSNEGLSSSVGNQNKSFIAGTFNGWVYWLVVQYWTHDNW